MNKHLFNVKTLVAGLLFLVFASVFNLTYFELILDSFNRGFRYPVLVAEVIIYPLYFMGFLIHLFLKIYKEKKVDWSTVAFIAKYFAFYIFIFFIFFIMGMALN